MPKRNLILIVALIVAAVGAVLLTYNHPTAIDLAQPQYEPHPLAQASKLIRDTYYRDVDEDKLHCDALAGMVEGLDEFSHYIPPAKLKDFQSHMQGSYRGVGLKIERVGGKIAVIGPMLYSSAHRAGMRTGDVLLSINKKEVGSLSVQQVYELLDNGPRSSVKIAFQRAGETLTVELARTEIPLETVVGLCRDSSGQWEHWLDRKEGIAYIRIKEFCPGTCESMERVLGQLPTPRAIVLDLRDNPGGSLLSAVGVANLFIQNGLIVRSRDRLRKEDAYYAHPEKTYSSMMPLIILINSRTASAAEIVAGSLSLHARAVLVGTRSRGKGCVQSLFSLGHQLGQMSLTTSEYFLAGNYRITRKPGGARWGIDPDVPAASIEDDELAALRLRGEVFYWPARHTLPASAPDDRRQILQNILEMDSQLAVAIQILASPDKMKSLLRSPAAASAPASREHIEELDE